MPIGATWPFLSVLYPSLANVVSRPFVLDGWASMYKHSISSFSSEFNSRKVFRPFADVMRTHWPIVVSSELLHCGSSQLYSVVPSCQILWQVPQNLPLELMSILTSKVLSSS